MLIRANKTIIIADQLRSPVTISKFAFTKTHFQCEIKSLKSAKENLII